MNGSNQGKPHPGVQGVGSKGLGVTTGNRGGCLRLQVEQSRIELRLERPVELTEGVSLNDEAFSHSATATALGP